MLAGTFEVSSPDLLRALGGEQPVELYGIDPASFARAVGWTAVPGGASAVRQTGGRPRGRVHAAGAPPGTARGGQLSGRLVSAMQVAVILPRWPGLGAANSDWIVLPWADLAGPLQSSGQFGEGGMAGAALLDLAPHARMAPILHALRQQARPGTAQYRGTRLAGFGPLLFLIAPLWLGVAWLGWRRWPSWPVADPAAVWALGAEMVAAARRRWFRRVQAWALAAVPLVAAGGSVLRLQGCDLPSAGVGGADRGADAGLPGDARRHSGRLPAVCRAAPARIDEPAGPAAGAGAGLVRCRRRRGL